MGRRRGEVEILIDILSAALKGAKFTNLMYRANLNFSGLRRYLSAMLEQGLIAVNKNGEFAVYTVTEKGKLVLDKLTEIEQVLRV